MKGYDPIARALKLRESMLDLPGKRILLANFSGTAQAKDIATHARFADDVFRAKVYTKPEERGLNLFRGEPALVAAQKLAIPGRECNAVFLGQINGCNLNCWQCYVDRVNRSGSQKYGRFYSAEEYLTQFLVWSRRNQNSRNPDDKLNILRISGGEVFIVPEFIYWVVDAVERFGLTEYLYIWVDCNLSTNDFFWNYLTDEQRKKISEFRNIGFCVCYKGIDEDNLFEITGANPDYFMSQFAMHRRLIDEGLDVYSYVYPLVSSVKGLRGRLIRFMELLAKEVDGYAPLRLAMPETKIYGPTEKNLTPSRRRALANQWEAMKIWRAELLRRFEFKELCKWPHQLPAKRPL